ncbi:MAG: glycosyltransferase [Myxococcaceae bacterium]|nr:glycosyltransferase [Myxococcaceae bacterium]
MLHELQISHQPYECWEAYATPQQMEALRKSAETMRERLAGRAFWTVSSTAVGGGVAETLRPLLGYVRGAGLNARWVVIVGPPDFFRITKRLHNALHGEGDADGAARLTAEDRCVYEKTLFRNALELAGLVRPGDVVMLHDPQTAGLLPHLVRLGAHVVWRCHIGHDTLTDGVRDAWDFLLPYLEHAAVLVFTRAAYVPPQLAGRPIEVIPPSIDPFSAKNQVLSEGAVRAILAHVGLLDAPAYERDACFLRQDGTPGRVDRAADVIRLGRAASPDVPLVVQVSRWDRLKDPLGVLEGFGASEELLSEHGAELVLAGPNVNAVADDPEGAGVFDEVVDAWRALPHHQRRRVHLANLPMADVEENAAIVNALQRHAAVVVQKSLHEGFGLTVTEAMWKARPVVASAVGGIQDQMEDGVHGLLLKDPRDLPAFGHAVRKLLDAPEEARQMGARAHARVHERFLGLTSLFRFSALLERLDA